MSTDAIDGWTHDHTFGHKRQMPGERRTLTVAAIPATMMVVEITCGVLFGSMALLADGLHMASHAIALMIAYRAYVCAPRFAADECFRLGTGKLNSLAGFTGAILLERPVPQRVAVRAAIETDQVSRISDLHIRSSGSGRSATIIAVVTDAPTPPQAYKALIPPGTWPRARDRGGQPERAP